MMPKSVIGLLFWLAFIPTFIALLVFGEQKEGQSALSYYFKKTLIAVGVSLVWLGGISYYLISNGI